MYIVSAWSKLFFLLMGCTISVEATVLDNNVLPQINTQKFKK